MSAQTMARQGSGLVALLAVVGCSGVRTSSASSVASGDEKGQPTFAGDVAPILYRNCATCHRPGGMAPFSVLDYASTVKHVGEMGAAIAQGVMPPWHAAAPRGVFSNDRRLSDGDRSTLLRWIDSGAKPGDLRKLPPRPAFVSTWTIGTPDVVVTIPEEFAVPASGTVEYQYFQARVNIPGDRWVQAIEIMPGAREVVHHVLVYAYVPPAPKGANAAAAAPPAAPLLLRNPAHATPPAPPRGDSSHTRPERMGSLVGTYVPGTSVIEFPTGTALRLRPGTVLTFQMHYTTHGHAVHDRTAIGFTFAREAPGEEIFAAWFHNGSLVIPAGVRDVPVPAEIGFSQPVRIWGLMPHTHLRGTRWLYKLEKPDGTTQVVLDVPHYDFNWQTYYMFAKPLDLVPGTKLTSMAWYDNSATNTHNPDPAKEVRWGDQTWEEMQYTGFLYSVVGRGTEKP
jgi:hypothetical protein